MLKFSDLKDGVVYPIFYVYSGKVYKKTCVVIHRKSGEYIDIAIYDSKGNRTYIWQDDAFFMRVYEIDRVSYYGYYLDVNPAHKSVIDALREKRKELGSRILRAQLAYKKMLEECME